MEIAKTGIDYQREESRIQRILSQGKIENRNDYEYIKNMLVVAQQENRITSQQAIELDRMLHRYENRGIKKK